MANNIFVGNDPLLGGRAYDIPSPDDIDARIQRLQEAQNQLQQQKQIIINPQVQQSKTPVWDEIENIIAGLTDSEFHRISESKEFIESNQSIMTILQREYMRIMRPLVEGTKDGKEVLEKHLSIVKNLKKSIADESAKNIELFNEYTQHYSDMTYAAFIEMKKKGGKKK